VADGLTGKKLYVPWTQYPGLIEGLHVLPSDEKRNFHLPYSIKGVILL
jgi:hypothetical protein